MDGLVQHIETHDHPISALTLEQFLRLLALEENYYSSQPKGGTEMLTHLRKIFYGTSGWDNELIRGGSHIPCRYLIRVVGSAMRRSSMKHRKRTASGTLNQCVEVIVREGDWMNPNAGTQPEIFADNHQEVILPNGLICDIGHVLAGMDAISYPAPVAPLPNWLLWMFPLVPHVDDNADAATWIGDLSSISGEVFFYHLQNKKWPDQEQVQAIIDEGNPAADMLGNIDSLAVRQLFRISTEKRTSDILGEYFQQLELQPKLRYELFCRTVGIELGQDGTITNRHKWIRKYGRQLKSCTAFYVANGYQGIARYWYALTIWLGYNKKALLIDDILSLQLDAIEQLLKK